MEIFNKIAVWSNPTRTNYDDLGSRYRFYNAFYDVCD